MNDEGFREIQLNGKQLIFLFMAVAVVLVVTFLFGVLTGRGVREGAATAQIASNDITPDSGLTPVADHHPAPPAAAGVSESQAPAAAQPAEELSYAERLLRDTAPEEKLKETAAPEPAASAPVVQEPVAQPSPDASARQAPPSPEASARQAKPPAPPPPPAPNDTAPATVLPAGRSAQPRSVPAPAASVPEADPAGPGFAVQVAAYRDRRDADTLAKQLTAKGYPAFVMDPVKGTSTALFRVRVGKYKTLKDAQAIEARLQSSEQLTNAWIAR